MNLIEGLLSELVRVRELLKIYEEIGPAGQFARTMMRLEIERAEKAMSEDDTVQMLKSYQALKEFEE